LYEGGVSIGRNDEVKDEDLGLYHSLSKKFKHLSFSSREANIQRHHQLHLQLNPQLNLNSVLN